MALRTDPVNVMSGPQQTGVVSTPDAPQLRPFPVPFACPTCRSLLVPVAEETLRCEVDQRDYARVDGIWRLLPAERTAYYQQFIHEYETVRRAEGRGSDDPAYFRCLPFNDLTGRFNADWAIRAKSFSTLVERVLRPLEERQRRPLTVLDLGAGNGWLAHRLALRGHQVAAVDLTLDPHDGLGAHVHYATQFTPIQAEFDWLPFESGAADLVMFNGSLHYSADVLTTIQESLRVLRPDGILLIMDSPVYRDPASGAAMVQERAELFTRRYGFPSNAVPMENYLTYRRLDDLAASTGLHWHVIRPWYGLRWALRPWRARLRRAREPANFLVIVGERVNSGTDLGERRAPIRVLWRLLLRLSLPLKRRRLRRPVLEQIGGRPLLVLPQVFNPRLMRSGEFFAHALDDNLIPAGSTVLDMGTGSGIGAIAAAGMARRVVAVDINPEAVRCARINALLSRVEDRVEVRLGDLFDPVAGERFDVVLFNPPYYRGRPRGLLDQAWRSTDVAERFAHGLRDHLTPGGTALIVLSTDGEADTFLASFRSQGFAAEVVTQCDFVNEVLTIYRLRGGEHGPDDHPV